MILPLLLTLTTFADDFQQTLEGIRSQSKCPAIACAIVKLDQPIRTWISGVRKQGEPEKATLNDLWHLGSDTKAMTAVLVAQQVEKGKIRYESVLPEIFPKMDISSIFDEVTLRQVLSMKAGFPHDPPGEGWWAYDRSGKSLFDQRHKAVEDALSVSKSDSIGKYEYSNLGFVMAGHAVEAWTGKPIEELLTERLFKPLGMKSAGYGPTGKGQPWPHGEDGPLPEKDGPSADNPAVMTAAGRVHVTIQDWAKFAREILVAYDGESSVIPKSYIQEMKANPLGGNYSMGWITAERAWGKGRVYTHSGSNTVNYCTVWLAPNAGTAYLVNINYGGKGAAETCDSVIAAMIKLDRG